MQTKKEPKSLCNAVNETLFDDDVSLLKSSILRLKVKFKRNYKAKNLSVLCVWSDLYMFVIIILYVLFVFVHFVWANFTAGN